MTWLKNSFILINNTTRPARTRFLTVVLIRLLDSYHAILSFKGSQYNFVILSILLSGFAWSQVAFGSLHLVSPMLRP